MNQPGRLVLDRFDYMGMRMPGVGNPDAAGEIQIPLPVGRVQIHALAIINEKVT
jgi:hypothetical protein